MVFGVLNPEKIWHDQLVHLPTSAVYSSHFTLGNPKKSFSTVLFIHTACYLRYLRRKQIVAPYPPHLKNVTALPCKMQNFFIWLKVCCVPPNVGDSETKSNLNLRKLYLGIDKICYEMISFLWTDKFVLILPVSISPLHFARLKT